MLHHDRRWAVTPVATAEDLAHKLTEHTWTCCTAFQIDDYLWLNDATSPDGAQEYAAIKRVGPNGQPLQIESITFSWCDTNEALQHIERSLRGDDDGNDFAREVTPQLETQDEHGRCCHCA